MQEKEREQKLIETLSKFTNDEEESDSGENEATPFSEFADDISEHLERASHLINQGCTGLGLAKICLDAFL